MARERLAGRENWQAEGLERGLTAEALFSYHMARYLHGTDFFTYDKPKDLAGIYGYHSPTRPHGIRPDYLIRNKVTGKAVFVEVKRQRAAGNAHERACKYMMPGILNSARTIANQSDSVVPFWWVFTNGIAVNPGCRREILHWFQGIEGNVLLWQNMDSEREVLAHFETHIRPMLL